MSFFFSWQDGNGGTLLPPGFTYITDDTGRFIVDALGRFVIADTYLPTTGLVMHYATDRSAYLTLAGSAITQFLDLSGNGNHTGIQSSAGLRPVWTANQQGGLPTAVFTSDTLALPSFALTLPTGSNTSICIAKRTTEAGVTNNIYSVTQNGIKNNYAAGYSATSGNIDVRNGNSPANKLTSTGNTNTNYNIIAYKRIGITQWISINGGAWLSNDLAEDGTLMDHGFIGSIDGNDSLLIGGIAEMLFYNIALSDVQITAAVAYLSSKWGI